MTLADVVDEHRRRIRSRVAAADVRLSGSASVEGVDADDLDLVVLVDDVAKAATPLAGVYPPLCPEQWRDDWAAFRDPGPPQVDVVLTRLGTRGDAHHRRAWERLARDPSLLDEYRRLKATGDDHELRKAAFFERVVAELGDDPA